MIRRRDVLRHIGAAAALSITGPIVAAADPKRKKVLLDTDIGSDIDDAVALAYLLRQPACELLGITTVTGDAVGRARLAASLCDLAGLDVPIYPGEESPLVIGQMQPEAPQVRRLGDDSRSFEADKAIPFLRETIRTHPGEVTLLAVGPLTNIARLFEADPEIPGMLAELVWMGGKYSDYPTPWGPTEWNAIVDPHATARVLSAPVRAIRVVGLDITWRVSMTPREVAARFTGDPLLERVLDWSEIWFEERELLHFHDPLAAVALFAPGVMALEAGDIRVNLRQGDGQGVTTFTPRRGSSTRAAVGVDALAFFREYFGVFR